MRTVPLGRVPHVRLRAPDEMLDLDIALPGMTGPDLRREFALRGQEIPIVLITALAAESIAGS